MSADRTIHDAATRSRPGEPTHLVFCDVDETLIHCKGLLEFLDHYFAERHGPHGRRHAAGVRAQLAAVTAAGGGRDEANALFYRAWRGEPLAEVRRSGRRWYAVRRSAGGFFVDATRTALRRHRAQGAELALVSGSFAAVLDPLAEECGAAHILCTRPVVADGVLTGEVTGAPMIGEGKRRAVRALLARHPHVDPADCHAYGDHVSDLPMLLEVGHPTVVGESAALLEGLRAARRTVLA
ncbi:HAD family hydrolase [Streptomyces sp. STR69]|uniref:HAD family hydrolase n=1 Tax=Streptomyces sp. STR69 TaxID=1796942 RepID=UPI0021C8F976|nr:HAD-IB family hydrolase [Streptomyces sp. STR69]